MKQWLGLTGLFLIITSCCPAPIPEPITQDLSARYVTLGKKITVELKWTPKSPEVTVSGRRFNAEVQGKTVSFIIPAPKEGTTANQGWGGPQTLTIKDDKNTATGKLKVLGEAIINADEPNTFLILSTTQATPEQLEKIVKSIDPNLKYEIVRLGGPGACGGHMVKVTYEGNDFEKILEILDQRVAENPDLIAGANPVGSWLITQLNSYPVEAKQETNAYVAHKNGITGKGSLIAVLDTGISAKAAEEWGTRLKPGKAYTKVGESNNTDDNYVGTLKIEGVVDGPSEVTVYGHGTQVASLAAGKAHGIAPEAEVYPVKVCDEKGKCRTGDVLRGVCWAMTEANNQGKLKDLILNLSLGTDTGGFEKHAMEVVLKSALEQGVNVVTSAGNQWAEYMNIEQQAYPPVNYPAALELKGLIAVGSVSNFVDNVKEMSSFSNRGLWVDILAPGSLVYAVNANGQTNSSNAGTSFAAPQVAGAVALWKQVKPNLTPEQVEEILKNTASTTKLVLEPGDVGKVTNRVLDLGMESKGIDTPGESAK